MFAPPRNLSNFDVIKFIETFIWLCLITSAIKDVYDWVNGKVLLAIPGTEEERKRRIGARKKN